VTATATGTTLSLGIAEVKTVHAPDCVRTVLGSCIGIALFDTAARVGGMAHVMLPAAGRSDGAPGKFADTGTDLLIEMVLAAGAVRGRLVAKIAGGAMMFGTASDTGIGSRNAQAVVERLSHHGIGLAGSDVGGTHGRRMRLDPRSGSVEVQAIGQQPRIL